LAFLLRIAHNRQHSSRPLYSHNIRQPERCRDQKFTHEFLRKDATIIGPTGDAQLTMK
jgi:hypothetical protein